MFLKSGDGVFRPGGVGIHFWVICSLKFAGAQFCEELEVPLKVIVKILCGNSGDTVVEDSSGVCRYGLGEAGGEDARGRLWDKRVGVLFPFDHEGDNAVGSIIPHLVEHALDGGLLFGALEHNVDECSKSSYTGPVRSASDGGADVGVGDGRAEIFQTLGLAVGVCGVWRHIRGLAPVDNCLV